MSYDNPSTADHRKSAKTIRESGLFDAQYYLNTYAEVRRSGMDPLDHFIRYGASQGLKPNKNFDTLFYLAENNHIYSKGINPLVHFIEYGRAAGAATAAVNEVQAFDAFDRAIRSGMFTASPTAERIDSVSFGTTGTSKATNGLSLPPLELAQRVGSPDLDHFDGVGQAGALAVRRLIAPFSFSGKRCMDFGCGAGRVIRHFASEAECSEFWGCDIDGTSVYWLSEHLTPPFNFFQLGDAPVLPFEDNSFDLVCAIGVFCQIVRDWQLWALEIRRILKPGGRLVMTYNGQGVFERTFPHRASFEDFMADRGMYVMKPYLSWNQGGPQVIHSIPWIQKMWGSIFDIDYVARNGFMDYQDVCMMRKPVSHDRRSRNVAPVHSLGTSQDFNPKAVGRIDASIDHSKPFLESYGIEAQRGQIEVFGTIAFENDVPVKAQLYIEDDEIACDPLFTSQGRLKNWDADDYTFSIRGDFANAPAGKNTLRVRLHSLGGIAHVLSIPVSLT